MKLYMFWTVRLSINSLFTAHSAMVHLVGFITKKFVTMHGHMNETYRDITVSDSCHQSLPVSLLNLTKFQEGRA